MKEPATLDKVLDGKDKAVADDSRQNVAHSELSRRGVLGFAAAGAAGLGLGMLARPAEAHSERVRAAGNPIIPGRGICDPQIRVWNDEVWLYATHDADPAAKGFIMRDWHIWRSRDLVNWREAGTLKPEQTYWRKPSDQCWATDAARKDGRYYLYFSRGPKEIGVVVADHPAGPWRDPIGKPLIAEGLVKTEARDPGILQDADGTNYLVFGTFRYFIARLGKDMVSLAEAPRPLKIEKAIGPYAKGLTDDKPFLHRRGDLYYLSWGSYYAIGRSPYGPFETQGSVLSEATTDPELRLMRPGVRYDPLNYDRHGSFFELNGQWYFACNDQATPGATEFYRNSVISYVHYRADGTIAPVRLSTIGVGQYDLRRGITAADFFDTRGGAVVHLGGDVFALELSPGGLARYPNVRGLSPALIILANGPLEIRSGSPRGHLLARGTGRLAIASRRATEDLYLVNNSAATVRVDELRLEAAS